MHGRGQRRIGVGLWLVFSVIIGSAARADSSDTQTVTVTARVVDTSGGPVLPIVQFTGEAAPTAILTITRGGAQVTQQTLNSSGAFAVTLNDQPVGQQSYVISAVDAAGAALAPVTFALNLALGTNTIVTGVFLGPSIGLDKTSVKLGQFLTASGSTAPDSAVTVTVHSLHALSFSVTADTAGHWSKLINSQDVGVGTHTASARAVMGGSQASASSATVSFAVNPLGQFDGKATSDLNGDDRVNLTDFSILLFFWQQVNPSNGRADINGDGRVDVVDFSIMLFQWTA